MASYFVRNDGDNAKDGLSHETAFRSPSYAHSVAIPGDVVKCLRGDEWEEDLILAKAGLENHPIQLDCYGDENLPLPVISGFKTLTGWTAIGNGYYKINDSSLQARTNLLLIDQNLSTVARHPRAGYNQITSGGGTDAGTVSDSANLNASAKNFTGAEVCPRKIQWILDRPMITSHSGSTLTFAGGNAAYPVLPNWGYFIQNHRQCCNQLHDWCQEGKDIIMYFGSSNPSDYTIQAAYKERINISNRGYTRFNHIHFTGFNGGSSSTGEDPAFRVSGSPQIHWDDCKFSFMGNTVMYFTASNNNGFKIRGCHFSDCLNMAVWNRYTDTTPAFEVVGNTFERIGMVPGAGARGGVSYTCIAFNTSSNGAVIKNNRILGCGYNGINYGGDSFLIKDNFIQHANQVLTDGGGIYGYGKGLTGKAYNKANRIIEGNIVLDCKGTAEGRPSYFAGNPSYSGHCIYNDDDVEHVIIRKNTGAGSVYGCFIHNNRHMDVVDNIFFDNESQIKVANDNLGFFDVRNINVTGNLMYAKPGQLTLDMNTNKNDIALFGTIDNNYHMRPSNESGLIKIVDTGTKIYSLEQWKGRGYDQNSLGCPTGSLEVELIYNNGLAPVQHPLSKIRINQDGMTISSSLELLPFQAMLLFDDLGDIGIAFHTVTLIAGEGGTVTGGGSIKAGTQAMATAHPAEGYTFKHWSNGATANPHIFTVTADVELTATFEAIEVEEPDPVDPVDPVDPDPIPDQIDFSLSVRMPAHMYRSILAAIRPYKEPPG